MVVYLFKTNASLILVRKTIFLSHEMVWVCCPLKEKKHSMFSGGKERFMPLDQMSNLTMRVLEKLPFLSLHWFWECSSTCVLECMSVCVRALVWWRRHVLISSLSGCSMDLISTLCILGNCTFSVCPLSVAPGILLEEEDDGLLLSRGGEARDNASTVLAIHL